MERPEHIEKLVNSVDRYNPTNATILEEYVQDQLSNQTFDSFANLALLKLYQFNPTFLSPSHTLSSLLLALIHAPFGPEFNLAWSLLSESFVVGAPLPADEDGTEVAPAGEKESAEKLRSLSDLIRARKFRLFWAALKEDGLAGVVDGAKDYEQILRTKISEEVSKCFKDISTSLFASFLGLEVEEVASIVERNGWKTEENVVHIPANENNSPVSSIQRENISIDQLSRLLTPTKAF